LFSNNEQIIFGLVVLVIAILLLNRNNEGFRACTKAEKDMDKAYETECYYTGNADGKAVGDYCKSINGDWSKGGCHQIGGTRRKCNCIYWAQKSTAELKAKEALGYNT
jgi:hypothetical protein